MRAENVLDDPAVLAAPGPASMLALAADLGNQLRAAFSAARSVPNPPSGDGVRSVVVCGMGGSGISGDLVRVLYSPRLPIPVAVVKGYALPEFCGRDTLVLASSFSGNTEETVAAYTAAVARGCRVVAITSGGELASLAEADQVPWVRLPPDIPMPRAAIGHLAGGPIGLLDGIGLIPPAGTEVEAAALLLAGLAGGLGPDVPAQSNEAKQLASWIGGRTPVVWGTEGIAEAAALRWKTQVNENAKGPAWHGVLPELDHNEIEGWSPGTGEAYAAVVLRHAGDHPRVALRVDATIEAVSASGLEARRVHGSGSSSLQRLLSLIMMGDFVASYLGVLRGHDPMPIPVLTALKRRLGP